MVRILVVDDDLAIRDMLCMMLEYAGYDVVGVAEGSEALTILRTTQEHFVVLLDLMMPTMSGLDILHAVATEAYLVAHHCYALVTASRDLQLLTQEPVVKMLNVSVLGKPFEMRSLLHMVNVIEQRIQTTAEVPLAS